MVPQRHQSYDQTRSRVRYLIACCLLVFAALTQVQSAEAACPGTDGTGSNVVYESCAEGKQTVNTTTVVVNVPAGVNSGDLLIAAITTDRNEVIGTPPGWIEIAQITDGANHVTTAVFKRISDGAEPANYTFSWSTNERAYGYIMRFTGTTGETIVSTNSGFGNSPVSPSVTTTSVDNMILRIGGYDDDDVVIDPATIIAGHTNITQDENNSGNGTASSSAAYVDQAGIGASGTANFSLTNNEEWVTVTVAIEPGAAPPPTPVPFLCPGLEGIAAAGLVEFLDCTETKVDGALSDITIATPASAVEGNFMMAFITTDGNETLTEPAGWTALSEATNSGMTWGVYYKYVEAAEPGTHNWTIGTTEELYGYILLFADASGNLISSFQSSAVDGTVATALSINTLVDDTLVLRVVGHDDDDLTTDPSSVLAGLSNIISDSSSSGGGTTSGQAAYENQATAGATGTESFSLTANEEWRTATIGIEPIEFRFSMPDTTASVCGAQQVTLSVTDRLGAPVTSFVGTVTLSATNSANATWANPGGLNGTLNDLGTGNATYVFDGADNGVAVFEYHNPDTGVVNFGLNYDDNGPVFSEHPSFDPSLTIDNLCEFRISLADGSLGACSVELVTIGTYDSEGVAATHYTGSINIDNSTSTNGDFALSVGAGSLTNGGGDDGDADYAYVLGDVGEVVLGFSSTTIEVVNFSVVDSSNPTFLVNGGFDPNLTVANCEISITHDSAADACIAEAITISIREPGAGPIITGFTGTVTLNSDALAGTWTVDTATNALTDNGSGEVEYTFAGADNGQIILDYLLAQVTTVGFSATSTTPGFTSVDVNNPLTISACTVRVSIATTFNVCSASTPLTLSIFDSAGLSPVTDYAGTIVINNDKTEGDYISTTGLGTLTNGTADDGLATYEFVAGDLGTVDIEYSTDAVTVALDPVAFTASNASVNFDEPNSTYELDVLACEFRIAFGGTTDICSPPTTATISVFNSAGSAVTDYASTINLSTDSGNGTWTNNSGTGTFLDPVNGDGSAAYTFVPGDLGVVVLNFGSTVNETLNVNVVDGVTSDSNASFDPNLLIDDCTFRISMVDETMNACSNELVTISVFNSAGAAATTYTGTATITTDTLHGNWSVDTGAGTLTEVFGDDNGMASYEFDGADNGVVVLSFESPHSEVVSVDAVDGDIAVDGGFDPNLEVTSCIPGAQGIACDRTGTQSASLALTARATNPDQRGRMVVMVIWQIDTEDVTDAPTFDGTGMTLIHKQENGAGPGISIEMWGILDADLPVAAGNYNGAYLMDAVPANQPSMCMVELTDVAQAFPTSTGTSAGQVHSTTGGTTGTLSTGITTTENNAYILSAGLTDFTQEPNSWFNDILPDPPMANIFSAGNNDARPVGGTSVGSGGVSSIAGAFTVTDIDNTAATTGTTHIVASFNPLVEGDPEATGYEPVTLFDTLSGNLSYRAIGATLRTATGASCAMVDFVTGTTATLTLPAGSTVEKAYLYWGGSGAGGTIDNDIDFGPTGSELSITADDTFIIDNGGIDFFASYKDVTAQVSGSGPYGVQNFVVQTGAPWANSFCVGGWSLIVAYENDDERLRVINFFHGFQPFQNSAFQLVPRNFRMASADGGFVPNGQITHFTLEGEDNINGSESLSIQTEPGSVAFNALSNSFNPGGSDFNGTVSRPIFAIDGGSGKYEFQPTAGINADGYEADSTTSYAHDVDTHFIEGPNFGDDLYEFADTPGSEAESFVTEYSSGGDYVVLISEVVSITNAPIADMELTISESGTFKVNGTGAYQFSVSNNGDGTTGGGFANDQVLVADVLPAGLTLDSVSGDGWDCSLTSGSAFTCEFDIGTDCTTPRGCATPNQLAMGETLPLITANVLVGDTAAFPLISNDVKNVGRMIHSGGSCPVLAAGVVPAPSTCDRANQYDDVFDLQNEAVDINDLEDKSAANNNVDSIITSISGTLTNLSIEKSVVGILEVSSAATYEIEVTNLGPDTTTGTITVTDNQPTGVTFGVASGTGWSCGGGASLVCTYAAALAPAGTATITLDVTVTGAEGVFVSNTASVSSGTFDFDTVSTNDNSTDITQIVAPPVASNERFLLSVSVPGNSTAIGGLAAFENHDYFIEDPLTDIGELFFDNSAHFSSFGSSLSDADAVHLFKNGHIAISAASSSTVGSNVLAFEPEDIVVYDPIIGTATMLFDGSAIFDAGVLADQNIDAVYVKDNGRILFSTFGNASITYTGPTTVNITAGDIVEYNPSDGSATILVQDTDADVFNGVVQVDGIYMRVDDSDPNDNKDVFVLSIDENGTTNIGACGSCDPIGGTPLSRDDIVEFDDTGANPVTQNLFLGNQPLGVFSPADSDRTIDAIHVIEDGHLGHFAVTQSQAGSTCTAGEITITKHEGLSHIADTDYAGSISITTDIGQGDWGISVGGGTLDNGSADDGAATYTFVPSDNGEVTLFLTEETSSTINVNVTNGITSEAGAEDPNFDFNDVITAVTFRDEFTSSVFTNNNGSTNWAGAWTETDNEGSGPATGDIRITGGQMAITSTDTALNPPSMERVADLAAFSATEDVYLNFDYAYQFLNSGSDTFVVQARASDGVGYTTVHTFSGIGGTNLVPAPLSYNLTTVLGSPVWTSTAGIRFLVTGGYEGTSEIFFDNVEIATGTTDCGIGSIDHYEIRIEGVTGTSATTVNGIQCVGSLVTITGHNAGHLATASDELITLQTSTNKGDWTLNVGGGVFNNGGLDDGTATYDFTAAETGATFRFNYTDPTTDPELVNFNVSSLFSVDASEDPTLSVQSAGLLFYNETGDTSVNPIPLQIAGKNSDVAPLARVLTIEGVRTSDEDATACLPLFDPGNDLTIGFGLECLDPAVCVTNSATLNGIAIPVTNDNAGAGATSYTDITMSFATQATSGHSAAPLVFTFPDSGQMQLHAEMDVPLNNDPGGTLSGNTISGSSNAFIVRPFGFDIDFDDDRATNGTGGSAVSYATSAADPDIFATAETPFNATVTAVGWQLADDANNDGIPDDGAALYDNPVTPAYGNESTAGDYDVLVSLDSVVLPLTGVGTLTSGLFPAMTAGTQTKTMTFDDVGIIDLDATLVSSVDGSTPIDFMGTTVGLFGNVANVGRFAPDHFEIGAASIVSRPLATSQPMCIAPSNFTYMGEEFGMSAAVTARGSIGGITRNYVDAFAKLDATELGLGVFGAFDVQPGVDTILTSRLAAATVGAAPDIAWSTDPTTNGGEATFSGNLVLNRQLSGVQDGPYGGLTISLNTSDDDGIAFELDLDTDDVGGNDQAIIATEDFRYGRMIFDDSIGPELDPLDFSLRIQQWDGSTFADNTDDSCTVLFYNASENTAANRSIHFVAGSFLDNFSDGESVIESAAVIADSDQTVSIFQGRNYLQATGAETGDDRLFEASAAGDGNEGSALIEFDLNNGSLPYSLDFLSYDWRTPLEIFTETEDGIYTDNPRGILEFNQYRGHDRVINWQEMYIGN